MSSYLSCKVYNLFSNVICQYVTARYVKLSYCKYNFVCDIVSYCQHSYVILLCSMAKQKLTPTAKRMKAARDKRAAMTEDRRKKKAENQRKRRAAKKAGKNIKGKDYDHKDRKFKSVKANRGNDGNGTKKE